MATTYKNAQVQGTASTGTYATLYNTGAATTAVISTIAIANGGTVDATYRIGIMDSAGTPLLASGHFIAYDTTVAGNDTAFITVGIALSNTKYIRVSSSSANVNFNIFVSEIS